MLRRLIAAGGGQVEPQLLVRLWRVILSASTQAQAPIVLRLSQALAQDVGQRLRIAEHFCGMEVRVHDSTAEVFDSLARNGGDLAIVTPGSDWAQSFAEAAAHGAQLIGALPVIADGAPPQLLVFGHAVPQPSDHDDTVVLSQTGPDDALRSRARWSARSGSWTVTCLPGFLFADAPPPAGMVVAGRYPSPIEVTP
jgi:hypothetical protein